jgi:hypothetical protein
MRIGLRAALTRIEREAERRRPKDIFLLLRGPDGVYRTLDGKHPIKGAMIIYGEPGDERL